MYGRMIAACIQHCARARILRRVAQTIVARWVLALIPAVISGPASLGETCPAGWLEGDGIPGVNGTVYATISWDPDGAGPRTPVIVIGGSFSIAGDTVANDIAAYDPVARTWSAFSTGMSNGAQPHAVYALATLPNGELVAGGNFTTAGGVAALRIARWNGSTWQPCGAGFNNTVRAMITLENGDLLVGGAFSNIGPGVVRWDGTSWSGLGFGTGLVVYSLAQLHNGDIVAAGNFLTAGGAAASRISKWDGTSWSSLGTGMTGEVPPTIYTMNVLPNGDLIAGGQFDFAGGVSAKNVARWNGSSWSSMDTGISSVVYALTSLSDGSLYATDLSVLITGRKVSTLYLWNGSYWAARAYFDETAFALAPFGISDVLVGGLFTHTTSASAAYHITRFDGSTCAPLGTGLNDTVTCLTTLPNGNLLAGGTFTHAYDARASFIAEWNGAVWKEFGGGVGRDMKSLLSLPNGDVLAGGNFNSAGGVNNLLRIARWDGKTWNPLGLGLSSAPFAMTSLPNGDVVVGGAFTFANALPANRVARWDGENWSTLGDGLNNTVYSVQAMPNGDVIAGGLFSMSGSVPLARIARWDGSAWSPLGSGINGIVYALAVLPNGDLVAGGSFSTAGGAPANAVARWDGNAWSQIGSGLDAAVKALKVLPNGDLVAAGGFDIAHGGPTNCIAVWNGSTWSPFGSGIQSLFSDSPEVMALSVLPGGTLAAGGRFSTANGQISAHVAKYTFGGTSPEISVQPASQSACLGAPTGLTVEASGTGPLAFQWSKGGVPIDVDANPSAATATLIIATASGTDAGAYACEVSNTCGSINSGSAVLTIVPDFNGSGTVDTADLTLLLGHFGTSVPPFSGGDTNGDGTVNTLDLAAVLGAFGSTCP